MSPDGSIGGGASQAFRALYLDDLNGNLALTCGIENLTDEDYRIHGSGQNEAGVNGIFGVKVIW